MTLAANHQHRALLAIMAGGAAIVGLAVLTAGSLASTTAGDGSAGYQVESPVR